MLCVKGYSYSYNAVRKGVSKKGRVGDNKLLVSAITSETRIHGGRCVPSVLPLPVLLLLIRDD